MNAADIASANQAYATAFVDELVRGGLRHVVFCPGSRSTPLALALAQHPGIRLWQHVDERSAGFFALGIAKSLRTPAALLCTSGTAAANFLPAVVEAYYGQVPLLALTADRPPELRDVGAPQTIDQVGLFGRHAKWFFEMPLPEATPAALRRVRTTAARALSQAIAAPAGPVHLNFPFREPLVGEPGGEDPGPRESSTLMRRSGVPPTFREPGSPVEPDAPSLRTARADWGMSASHVSPWARVIQPGIRGLIVCGPQSDPEFPGAVTALAERLGFPILADPLSGVRCGPHHNDLVLDAYDAFLRDPGSTPAPSPTLILRFGAPPTSKPLSIYLEQHVGCRHILVDDGGYRDPAALSTDWIQVAPTEFCQALLFASGTGHIAQQRDGSGREWLQAWQQANARARLAIDEAIHTFTQPFEGRVFSELATLLPDRATLFVGSSMPVRDLDTFFPGQRRAIRFLANRGANGIDGVVSTALGVSATASGPVVLVLGYLSFYHDLNGLLAAKLHRLGLTIVLINNNGGGIFSFLPQAAHPKHFEHLFGTPLYLDFRPAIEMYGGSYHLSQDWQGFRTAVAAGLTSQRLTVVEVRTDRSDNVAQHRAVWAEIRRRAQRGIGQDQAGVFSKAPLQQSPTAFGQ